MSKHPARAAMDSAIREVVIPDLRRRGFRGAFPHFRRTRDDRLDLLTFQFYSSGGSFVVEVAQCGSEVDVPPSELTASYVGVGKRLRLGSDPTRGRWDHWFKFGKRNYEKGHNRVEAPDHYRRIAHQVKMLLECQAEPYWSSGGTVEPSPPAGGTLRVIQRKIERVFRQRPRSALARKP